LLFGGLIASGWHTASLCQPLLVDSFLPVLCNHGRQGPFPPQHPSVSMILIQITCHTLMKQKPFDELGYRQMLKRHINLTPEEIPEALYSEFRGELFQ